jgi:limonene-1,2-epoxide hydrolase
MNAIESERFVADFLASWRDRDLGKIMSAFSEASVYHNVPVEPIKGLAGIRAIFESFLREFTFASLDVVEIVARPGLVMAERIDRFTTTTGLTVTLPVTGVFAVTDGKILRFSDYFDLASFERQSGLKLKA